MQMRRDGEWLTVTRITGPHHNLLSLKLEQGGSALRMPTVEPLDEVAPEDGLAEADVEEAVRIGTAAANEQLGTSYRVTGIRFLRADTPRLQTYRMLAERLIHAAAQEESAPPRARAAG